jgi:ABC-type lipoprotein export system ATPase subunit
MEYALQALNITRTFSSPSGTHSPLVDVSLVLAPNDFLVITGPSGSGKSTLVGILSLMDKPTQGELWIEGKKTTLLSEQECAGLRGRKIALVNQSFNLLPNRTARENITLPAFLHQHPLQEDHLVSLCDRLGILRELDRPVIELSGGQKQRVAIARALSCNPSILIMDEPTGNLDQKNTDAVIDILQDLRNQKQFAIVLITHESSLTHLGNQLAILENGGLRYV